MRQSLRPGRRWIFVLACVLIGVISAGVYIVRTPTSYRASAQIYVTLSQSSSPADITALQQQMQSFISIPTSPKVTSPVRTSLGLDLSDKQLARLISADAPLDRTLLEIDITNGSASRASDIANAVANQTISVIQSVEPTTDKGVSLLNLTLLHPANRPTAPIAPQKKLAVIVGIIAGLLLGLGILFVRERLNERLRTVDDVLDTTDLPVIGVIPIDAVADGRRREPGAQLSPSASEAFRQLRTNLQFVDVDHPPRVVAVVSPSGGEGKTGVALNLARMVAEAGRRVGLVESDLRSPELAGTLGLDAKRGLTSVIAGNAVMRDVIQVDRSGLSVITSGEIPPNPADVLASQQARSAIRGLTRIFDLALVDTTALLPVADGAEVASMTDACLIVVRLGSTGRREFLDTIDAVTKVSGRVAGIVLTGAPPRKVPVGALTPSAPAGDVAVVTGARNADARSAPAGSGRGAEADGSVPESSTSGSLNPDAAIGDLFEDDADNDGQFDGTPDEPAGVGSNTSGGRAAERRNRIGSESLTRRRRGRKVKDSAPAGRLAGYSHGRATSRGRS